MHAVHKGFNNVLIRKYYMEDRKVEVVDKAAICSIDHVVEDGKKEVSGIALRRIPG